MHSLYVSFCVNMHIKLDELCSLNGNISYQKYICINNTLGLLSNEVYFVSYIFSYRKLAERLILASLIQLML